MTPVAFAHVDLGISVCNAAVFKILDSSQAAVNRLLSHLAPYNKPRLQRNCVGLASSYERCQERITWPRYTIIYTMVAPQIVDVRS